MTKQVFTSVSSQGLAVGEYDVVHFTLSCEGGGAADEVVELASGKAHVNVSLTVSFSLKS